MFPYSQYASVKQEVLNKPVYDSVNKVFTVAGTVTYTIKKDALIQAQADAQSNITALNSYDPVAAAAGFQATVADITTALSTAI
jgi:hypothetical protein